MNKHSSILLVLLAFALLPLAAQGTPGEPAQKAAAPASIRPIPLFTGSFSFGAGCSALMPLGDYGEIASLCLGNSATVISPKLLDTIAFRLDLGFDYYASRGAAIESYQAGSVLLQAGYPIELLDDKLIVTPLLGGGILLHLEDKKYYDGTNTYLDTLVGASISAEYRITEAISAELMPSFLVGLENGNQIYVPSLALQALYHL